MSALVAARAKRFSTLPNRQLRPITSHWRRWFDAQDPDHNAGHDEVWAALEQLYTAAGLAVPEIEWHDSPRAALAAMAETVRRTRPTLFGDGPDGKMLAQQALHTSVGLDLVDAYCSQTGRVAGSIAGRRGRNILPAEVPGLLPPRKSLESRMWRIAFGAEIADRIGSWAAQQMGGVAWKPALAEITAPWGVISSYASWWWPLETRCHLARHPEETHEVPLSGMRQLHNPEGPALRFRDGFEVWMWGGVVVPKRVVLQPDTITIEEIERVRGAALREVIIDRYGLLKYLERTGATCVQQDDYGQLFRHPRRGPFPEEVVFVKVRNATPEPDGSIKDYRLRVPPETRTAREAVAWTFGLGASQYTPNCET